jgi:hypothetical protein
MSTYRIEAARMISASAPRIYPLIADYREGHPRIVPPRAFTNLEVIEGGYGAGTRIRFDMKAMGRVIACVATVREPEPGRILTETDEATGALSTFIVEPIGDGRSCRVTIATDMPNRRDLLAPIERFIVRRFLKSVYVEELDRIAQAATGGPAVR